MLALFLLPWHLWNGPVQIEESLIGGGSGGGVVRSSSQDSSPSQGGRDDGAAVSGLSDSYNGFYSAYV